MGILELLLLLVIAGACGFLASQLMGAKRLNIIVLVILGFAGAFVGKWIAGFLHLPLLWSPMIGGHSFPVVWAIVGSLVVVGIFSAIQQH